MVCSNLLVNGQAIIFKYNKNMPIEKSAGAVIFNQQLTHFFK